MLTFFAFGFALGFAVRHWWTPIRTWMCDTAWPWIRSKIFPPPSVGGS